MTMVEWGIEAMERGLLPDTMTRAAIRRLCRERLRVTRGQQGPHGTARQAAFEDSLHSGPIALLPERANQQHYELPAEFFHCILGPRRKYSCCFFPTDHASLPEAEEAALAVTCLRAELADGKEILELGCGWGSLSLWMAERYPNSRITAVSNSSLQRRFIENEAKARLLRNLRVITADMNDFSPGAQTFDRVVSVEMFEHMRNYDRLLHNIASWLKPDGKLFVHIFCHRDFTYPFETDGAANWMGRHFFTGGIMPGANLIAQFDRAMQVTRRYYWSGRHYQRTAEAWLKNLDAQRGEVLRILSVQHDATTARRMLNRWRVFFLAVAELFGYAGGDEWFVSHYLLEPARTAR